MIKGINLRENSSTNLITKWRGHLVSKALGNLFKLSSNIGKNPMLNRLTTPNLSSCPRMASFSTRWRRRNSMASTQSSWHLKVRNDRNWQIPVILWKDYRYCQLQMAWTMTNLCIKPWGRRFWRPELKRGIFNSALTKLWGEPSRLANLTEDTIHWLAKTRMAVYNRMNKSNETFTRPETCSAKCVTPTPCGINI